MADSILKLRVESQEYDQKIKRAAEGIQRYAQKCRDAGGTLQYLDDGVLEFVQALGKMDTVATGTKQQLREMSNALTTLTQTYRGLTDEEKASPFGQELAKGIQQLTERAGQAQDAMADVQASIRNAASDTRAFDQVSQGVSLMTSGFQTMTGAAKLFGVEMGNNEEVLTTLAAAMSVTNGLTAIQTALQKQSALMQGVQAAQASLAAAAQTTLAAATGSATVAQAAFNAVAKANPYVLLATAVIALGGALWAFSSASSEAKKKEEEFEKAQEETTKKAKEQRDAFINASAEAMNTASKISYLQTAYKNANSELEKTDILQQAQAEFKKFGIECKNVSEAQTLLIEKGADVIELIKLQGNVAAVSAIRMEKFKESFRKLMENGYDAGAASSLAGFNGDVMELDKQLSNMQSRAQNLKNSLGVGGSGGDAGGNTPKPKKEAKTAIENSIGYYQEEIKNWRSEQNDVTSTEEWDALQKKIDETTIKIKELKGELRGDKGASILDGAAKAARDDNKKAAERLNDPKVIEKGMANVMKTIKNSEKQDKKTMSEGFSKLAGGFSALNSGFESLGIDLGEGFKGVISGIQTVSSILTAVESIVTAIQIIMGVKSLFGMSNGGVIHAAGGFIVPGNNYSSDLVPAYLNSGELVLNRFQQMALAGTLENQGMKNIKLEAYVEGSKLHLVHNRYLKTANKGELVTW